MSKVIRLEDTREIILKTVDKIERLVCDTMGPDGQNIALHNGTGMPMITKDGVTVAEAIDFENAEEKIIADILKEAARKTNLVAGDGTTTSTCIAAAVTRAFNKLLASGEKPAKVREQILKYREAIAQQLEAIKTSVSDKTESEKLDILKKIALISTNGDEEISEIISKAVIQAGEEGLINVKTTYGDASVERADGVKIPNARFAHADFARGSADQTLTLNKCRFLLTTYELEDPNIINVLNEKVLKPIRKKGESLIVVGKSGKSFLQNMVKFNATGEIKNCIIQPPYFGDVGREMLDDIAAYLGAEIIDENKNHNFESVELEHLGYAEKAVITKEHTTVYSASSNEERLKKRLSLLEEAYGKLQLGQRDDRKVKERLASLSGNVFILNIPKTSNIEDGERLDRVEDAINACRGALTDGYVPGGGRALVVAFEKTMIAEEDILSKKMLKDICIAPMKRILSNAGEDYRIMEMKLLDNDNFSYDLRAGVIGDALEIGVIDSYKVILNAFKNGLSIGTTLMTCNGIIADKPAENPFPMEMGMY